MKTTIKTNHTAVEIGALSRSRYTEMISFRFLVICIELHWRQLCSDCRLLLTVGEKFFQTVKEVQGVTHTHTQRRNAALRCQRPEKQPNKP